MANIFQKDPAQTPPDTNVVYADNSSANPPFNIYNLVQDNKLPNDPAILDDIKSGKLNVQDVMDRHAQLQKQNAPQPIPMFSQTTPPDNAKANVLNQVAGDNTLKSMVANDQLPNDPAILQDITNGKLNIEDVVKRHAQVKANFPTMIGDSAGKINAPETLKQEPQSPDFAQKMQDGLAAGFDKAQKDMRYWAAKGVSGLSFGIADDKMAKLTGGFLDPNAQPTDMNAKVVGMWASLNGNIMTGMLGGMALKAVPVVGPAINAIEESAANATGLMKHAKAIAGVVAEAAPMGFVSGVAKSAIHGNGIKDVISDGLVDAAVFSAGGIALYPLAAGAGYLFGKAKMGRANAVNDLATKAGQDIAEAASKPIEEGGTVTRADNVIEALGQVPTEQKTPEMAKLEISLKKIRAANPEAGPGMALQIAQNPEVTKGLLSYDAKEAATNLFLKDGAPLKSLYDTNDSIKSMVDNGNYVDAVQSVQGAFRDQVKDYKTLGEVVAAPFTNDAKSVYDIVADRVLGRNNPDKYPGLTKNLLTDYFMNPTPENQAALSAVAPKRVLGNEVYGFGPDIRIRASEADKLVGNILETHLKSLAGDGSIKLGDIGKIKDTESILKAAITLNKDVSSKIIDSYRGWGDAQGQYAFAPKEIQDAIPDEINMRRIMLEKQGEMMSVVETRNKISDITQQIRDAKTGSIQKTEGGAKFVGMEDAQNIGRLNNQLDTLRTDYKDSAGRLYGMTSAFNDSAAKLNSLPDATQAQVRKFVDGVWLPTKSQMGVTNTSDYLSRFGYKDNPLYLKNNSQMADYMNALMVAGKDFSALPTKDIFSPLRPVSKGFLNIENVQRWVNKDFGPNNPIDQLIQQIKDRDAAATVTSNSYYDQIRGMGIKAGTKESALLQQFAEKRLLPTDPQFLNLPAETQQKIVSANKTLRGIYDEIIDGHNAMAEQMNIPQINKREDYVTHFQDTQETIGSMLKGFFNGDKEIINPFDGKAFNVSRLTSKADPTKTFLSWELPRQGTEFTDDAVGAMQKYIPSSMKRIFNMDLVREVDAAKAMAPENAGQFLQKIKENYLLGIPSDIEKMTPDSLKTELKFGQKMMAQGEIFYKANTALEKLSSTVMNLGINAKDALATIPQMFTQEGDRIWGQSTNKVLRNSVENVDLDAQLFKGALKDWNAVPGTESAKAGFDYYKQFGKWALQTFDQVSAKHAFLTGYRQALNAGADAGGAARYADRMVDALHNGMSQIDAPQYARSTLGRALFQFQSFTTNLAGTLMNDLPNMAFHDGPARAVSAIVRTVAGASIVNEVFKDMGIPAPLSLKTFIPLMSTYRMGVPGVLAAAKDLYQEFGDDAKASSAATAALGKMAWDLIPGGGQIRNMVTGYQQTEPGGKLPVADRAKAMIFGPGMVKIGEQQQQEEKYNPSPFEKARQGASKTVRKSIFGR